jgi:hypothetical protein
VQLRGARDQIGAEKADGGMIGARRDGNSILAPQKARGAPFTRNQLFSAGFLLGVCRGVLVSVGIFIAQLCD